MDPPSLVRKVQTMNTKTSTVRPGRVRRAVIAALTAAAIGAGSTLAAAPAHAAPPSGNIGACFQQNLMGAKGPLEFRDVYLDVVLNGSWYAFKTYYTNRAGCIPNIVVPAGNTYRFRVDLR